MALIFYDTETTGSDTYYDQILQFAAIRTDDALDELDRFEIRCRIQPHILPAPGALLVTGVTLEQLSDPALPSHFEMAEAIHQKLTDWSPAVFAGYNSLEFDEDLLRQAFYQSLLPVYLTNTNGSSRLDIIRLALAANEFEPGCLKIPVRDDGVPTFKLDRLAPANGFLHPNAHDAMADVEATIFVAKMVKEGAPWVWDHLLRMGQKAEALREAKAAPVRLYTVFCFNKPNHWLVSAIDADPSNKGNVIAFNLAHDPAELLSVGDDSLKKWASSKPKPLRTIKANSSPILLDIDKANGRADIMKLGELRAGMSALDGLLKLLAGLRVVVLVGRKAGRARPHLEGRGLPVIESAHPSPIVRASRPAAWHAIPDKWAEVLPYIRSSE